MASTKGMIALSTASVAEKMREWVRASYDYYDQFPDAFSYVFFTEHAFRQSWQEITTRQSRIFTRIIAQMQPTNSELALSHFSGVLINEGLLPRPALQYTDEVTRAFYRVFDLVEPTTATPRISIAS